MEAFGKAIAERFWRQSHYGVWLEVKDNKVYLGILTEGFEADGQMTPLKIHVRTIVGPGKLEPGANKYNDDQPIVKELDRFATNYNTKQATTK